MEWWRGRAYSQDLRLRVLAVSDWGLSARAVAVQFAVSVSYVDHGKDSGLCRARHKPGSSTYPNQDAGYFARDLRAVEVLIDQDTIRNGRAAGEPWKHYDLGHGYCTYDFFDQCPHRMACARCAFYVPEASSRALLLEGRANLLRLRQEIPLNDDELKAVDEGIAAHNELVAKLSHMPSPD